MSDSCDEDDILAVLEGQPSLLRQLAALIPAERETFRYAPGKWSIRELFGHMADAERVFGFRLFSFSRFDQSALPGFDENSYVDSAKFDERTLPELLDDFATVRDANLRVIRTLSERQWQSAGIANGNRVTVRALAYIMAGHVRHHMRILEQRYFVDR